MNKTLPALIALLAVTALATACHEEKADDSATRRARRRRPAGA